MLLERHGEKVPTTVPLDEIGALISRENLPQSIEELEVHCCVEHLRDFRGQLVLSFSFKTARFACSVASRRCIMPAPR